MKFEDERSKPGNLFRCFRLLIEVGIQLQQQRRAPFLLLSKWPDSEGYLPGRLGGKKKKGLVFQQLLCVSVPVIEILMNRPFLIRLKIEM